MTKDIRQPSTIGMENWARTKCKECGGHGGGHYENCLVLKNLSAISLGKLGGQAKSKKKTMSSRKNGKLGGRPKKSTNSIT